jgi:hypothetical protein
MLYRRAADLACVPLLCLVCLFCRSSQAQNLPAVSFTFSSQLDSYYSGSTAVVGYSITVNSPISVTDLEFYNLGGGGLGGSAQVGIWSNTGTLLAQTVIPAGTAAPILGGFRYEPLANPISLLQGDTYYVGGRASSTDSTMTNIPNVTFAPEITYNDGQFGPNGSFSFPSTAAGGNASSAGAFGGSFLFEPIPEPGELGLLILAGTGLGFACRRRRKPPKNFAPIEQ